MLHYFNVLDFFGHCNIAKWIEIQKCLQLSEHISIFTFCLLVLVFYMLAIAWFVLFLYTLYMFLFLPNVYDKCHAMSLSAELKSLFKITVAFFFFMQHNYHFLKSFYVTEVWPIVLCGFYQ